MTSSPYPLVGQPISVADLQAALEVRLSSGRGVSSRLDFADQQCGLVTSVTHDSRRVTAGSLFCCVPGMKSDGHDFAQSAVDAGAVALLVDHPLTTSPQVPCFVVDSVRDSLGIIAAEALGNPADHLTMIGVTGTNGKTSTAHLLGDMLTASGVRAAVIGTLTQTRTTPEATDLQATLAEHVNAGVTHVVMEVTSHALVLSRVRGIKFEVAVFTNLTQDHLDFHENMEAYFRAKAMLFEPSYSRRAVVNLDDPYGRLLRDASQIPTQGFQLSDVGDLQVGAPNLFSWRGHHVTLSLGGLFSVANALAAATTALSLGVPEETIVTSLATAHVPGRFEAVTAGQATTVIVDYAHTPDGLARVLDSAREMVNRRRLRSTARASQLHVVFGCGGDRDRNKRPIMGEIAVRLADHAILTSDNPRSESPQMIADDVLAGISDVSKLEVELDRRRAIHRALEAAGPDDIVVIAGKGHEQGQDIGGVVMPFDDRIVAAEELRSLGRLSS
jgi:UDP-N-acetylmuramoyl-L-alanyl-D-glutamate--2,6-diaminopimelate ligase